MMMTMREKTLQHVMMDPAVGRSLTLTAAMVGLPNATVTKIVTAGLPLMANVADENPLVGNALYALSEKSLPEPLRVFYARLGTNPKARQAMVDDFTTMFGDQTGLIRREAAIQAGATDEQVGEVLASTMPALVKALGKGNTGKNDLGFGRQLRNLNA